jgi:acetolactate synthase-1/3 small subunit
MKKTLAVTVFNEAGVLTRIATVFSSRGFNIDSLAVGPSEKSGVSRLILVLPGNEQSTDQVIKQLNKLVQIIEVKELSLVPCVERELMLIKIETNQASRREIIELSEIFKTRIVDISDVSISMEVTGDPGKIVTILELMKKYNVLEIVRTGKIALERQLGINTEFLKRM